MTKPKVSELNVETQELVIREMTDTEYEQYLIDISNYEIEKQKQAEADALAAAKAAAKAETLAALGLSQEVVNLLAE
jgi:hypothetical protein